MAIPLEDEIWYPESDGEPMAETQLHLQEMTYVIESLEERFRNDPGVFVAGNLFFYYQRGRRDAVVAPDAFVVKGLADGKSLRTKYLLWEEGGIPCFAAEMTSESTRKQDEGAKRELYERLGVEEYFLFDPEGDYLNPRLQGYRLAGGWYRPVAPEPDGSLRSTTTGIDFRAEGNRLRLTDAATGAPYLRRSEMEERLRVLQAELDRLRGR
jgi:Uma2 family endonuclease